LFTSDNSKAKGQENYSILEEVCPLAGFPPETLHSAREGAREAAVLQGEH